MRRHLQHESNLAVKDDTKLLHAKLIAEPPVAEKLVVFLYKKLEHQEYHPKIKFTCSEFKRFGNKKVAIMVNIDKKIN